MIHGWCPTVHAPMPTGDGLLSRVKPFGGRLTSAGLAALAEAATAYASGVIELTSRGHLQIRGVRDPASFARAMVRAGLADPDPLREARRNVVTVPPCDEAVVAEMEAELSETPGRPDKYGVVVRGADILPLPPPDLSESHLPVGGHLLHLPFGQTDAATLGRLATLAPELRTTPWRAFLSPVAIPGFDHPTRNAACPGAPACGSATVRTRDDALTLQAMGFSRVHVSGCAKGCAHHGPATTLVGHDGRYDLVRSGRAGDTPDVRGLTLPEVIAVL